MQKNLTHEQERAFTLALLNQTVVLPNTGPRPSEEEMVSARKAPRPSTAELAQRKQTIEVVKGIISRDPDFFTTAENTLERVTLESLTINRTNAQKAAIATVAQFVDDQRVKDDDGSIRMAVAEMYHIF